MHNKTLLTSALILLIGSSIIAQNSYRERVKRDSTEIASLADSIKAYPKKVFPNGTGFEWTVSGLDAPEKDTLFKRPSSRKYTRPSYTKKDSSNTKNDSSVNKTVKSAPEQMVYYIVNVTDNKKNHIGTIEFVRPKASTKVSWQKTIKTYSKMEEIKQVVPAEVLKKIITELKVQANEDISSLGIATYAEPWVSESQYKGDKVKEYVGEKKLDDKSFYWVHGTVNGSNTNGSYFFTMKGDYIPTYEHDLWYNQALKFKQ